jgi:RND family efflux transporter MFP subunit
MIQQNLNTPSETVTSTPAKRLARIVALVLIIVFLVAIGVIPRLHRQREALAAVNEAPATHPVVATTRPKQGEPTSELLLPGNIQPLYTADLFARVDGYLAQRNVDIGAKVKAGQVIAIISSPEIDQQLLQARAALAQADASVLQTKAALEQAKANAELSRLTKERDVPLGQEQAVSQQVVDAAVQSNDARLADVEAAKANIAAAEANVTANQANVARLLQMQKFEHIVAPFDGVITARNVERGDLIAIGNGSAKPLFSIAQSGTLRIQVDVPQSEAVNIRDGEKTSIDIRERLGRTYSGIVTRSAGALDNAARTMLTEVQVDNQDGSLIPGMYAQVRFTLPQQRTSLIIPTSALVVNHTGMHVVSVSDDHTVHYRQVVIGKDLGTTVEVLSGLKATDMIVASPNDLLSEGQHVEVR